MPKVSEQYRDARRAQIMDAARRCFVRNGFRETSMTDLFTESGLSAGAFYRYFVSKDELILAIAQENLRDIVAVIHTVAQDSDSLLGDALADAIELAEAKHAEKGMGAIAVQVWAEALRNPELAAQFTEVLDELYEEIATMVRRLQEAGKLPPGVSAEALSRILVGTVPGHMLQLALFGANATAGVPDALRALWANPSDVGGAVPGRP